MLHRPNGLKVVKTLLWKLFRKLLHHLPKITLQDLYRLDDKTYKNVLTKIVTVSVLVRPKISLHFKLDLKNCKITMVIVRQKIVQTFGQVFSVLIETVILLLHSSLLLDHFSKLILILILEFYTIIVFLDFDNLLTKKWLLVCENQKCFLQKFGLSTYNYCNTTSRKKFVCNYCILW